MKDTVSFFCIIAILFCNISCSVYYTPYQFDNGDDYYVEGSRRIVDKNGKIGFEDESGKVIIKPRFAFAFPFKNGIAKVTESGSKVEVTDSGGEYHYWDSDNWYNIDKTGNKLDY